MNVLVTFSGSIYDGTTKEIVKAGGWVYDDKWLMGEPFYRQNEWLWEHHHKRGFGWYAWKPYIILDALRRLSDGDIVLYLDADTVPVAPLDVLYNICAKDGIMLFASEGHRQYQWCKRDCYIVMGQDDSRYYDVPAGVARFMLFQKGRWQATQFLTEWLTYCVNPLATTFDPSVLGNELTGFIEHRTEQAIMTNLAHKYGLKLHREACQSGNGIARDLEYGQLFEQRGHESKVTVEPIGSRYCSWRI